MRATRGVRQSEHCLAIRPCAHDSSARAAGADATGRRWPTRNEHMFRGYVGASGPISDTIRGPRPHAVCSIVWLCCLAATPAEICRGDRLCLGGDIRRWLKSKRNFARGGAFMRKSTRLVSVVFSHLALLFGLVSLPTVGQGAPLNVLNWIPPTSSSLLTKAPCDFVAPTCDTSATSSGTIPMWLSSNTASSVPYSAEPIAMVGQDPSVKGTGSTSIDTRIIPLVFTGSISTTSYVFDPENNDSCSPQRIPALNMVQGSPVLKANKLVLGGVTLGSYQFGSQFLK
jgi:hypothetical protein